MEAIRGKLLDDETFACGLRHLTHRDPDLTAIVARYGPPPLWVRPPGFATLVRIILEQQVSLASARAAFHKLGLAVGRITPRRFLQLDAPTLKAIGFSRQKTMYAQSLAQAICLRRFQPRSVGTLPDATARQILCRLKGVGEWSADIYLLMALRRPDVWPKHDLALAVAMQDVKRLTVRPTPDQMERLGEPWRPWRAIAARLLWHYYLSHRAHRLTGGT